MIMQMKHIMYKDVKYCKGDHFAHEGPKPPYYQNYLLKDLWIGFLLLFYSFFAKKA